MSELGESLSLGQKVLAEDNITNALAKHVKLAGVTLIFATETEADKRAPDTFSAVVSE